MLRSVYRGLLRLHPPAFRQRFACEMLSIFDQAERQARFGLVADGFMSVARQWALRPEFWHEPTRGEQTASDGIPSFYMLDPFRPRTAAVIHGLVLTVAVFCLTCFAIRYSWIHVLHVHIPEVEFENSSSFEPGAAARATPEEPAVASRPESRTQRSVSEASPVSSANENHAASPPQHSVPQQKSEGTSRPAPPGRAANAVPPVFAVNSAQHGIIRSVTVPGPDSQHGFVASAEKGQAEAAIQPAASAPAAGQDFKIDAAERRRVVDGAAANLTRYYVDADLAQKMANALRAHEKTGNDDAATDGEALASLLTRQMQDVSHDGHVVMVYSAEGAAENAQAPPTAADMAAYRKEMERTNCKIEIVRMLPHNVGYLKINAFPDADICGTRAAAAMARLNDADAIIFDLRDNPGGYSNMVAFLATYLFDRPTHLNDFYNRGENTTEQSWTLAPVPGNKLAGKAAFILTSHSTFSAAEGFSYDLKMLKRATLVGETTSGRGHLGMPHRIDDHFTIQVPGIKVTNPISKANWEGTGVEPDVKAKAADALATTVRLAVLMVQQRYSTR